MSLNSVFVILKFNHTHLKFTVYGRKQASKHTHVCAQCSPASVGLAQARPNDSILADSRNPVLDDIYYHPLLDDSGHPVLDGIKYHLLLDDSSHSTCPRQWNMSTRKTVFLN